MSGETSADWMPRLLTALGGKVNLRSAIMHSLRMITDVTGGTRVDEGALSRCSARGFALPSARSNHVLVAPGSKFKVVELPTAQVTVGG
jgi:hypothetical protein